MKIWQKYCWLMQNALKYNKWQKFGSFKCLTLKYRREDQKIQPFCRVGSPQEIRSPLFNLSKFWKPQKSIAELYRMHLNLMNDKKFGSFKCLMLKYRRGEQIIQSFCRIGSLQEIRSPPLQVEETFKNCQKYCWIM